MIIGGFFSRRGDILFKCIFHRLSGRIDEYSVFLEHSISRKLYMYEYVGITAYESTGNLYVMLRED